MSSFLTCSQYFFTHINPITFCWLYLYFSIVVVSVLTIRACGLCKLLAWLPAQTSDRFDLAVKKKTRRVSRSDLQGKTRPAYTRSSSRVSKWSHALKERVDAAYFRRGRSPTDQSIVVYRRLDDREVVKSASPYICIFLLPLLLMISVVAWWLLKKAWNQWLPMEKTNVWSVIICILLCS